MGREREREERTQFPLAQLFYKPKCLSLCVCVCVCVCVRVVVFMGVGVGVCEKEMNR